MNNDYVSHHGIVGMHWGEKNGPPYPLAYGDHSASEKKAGWTKSLSSLADWNTARKHKKRLNKLDQKTVEAIDKAQIEREKGVRSAQRYADRALKTNNAKPGLDKKLDKYYNDAAKHGELSKQYMKEAMDLGKETWKAIGEAAYAGYDIDSKKVYRDARKGQRLVAQTLAGPIGQAAYASYMYSQGYGSGVIEGNKFTVKKTKSENGYGNVRMELRKVQDRDVR